jgi:hypothetical protein
VKFIFCKHIKNNQGYLIIDKRPSSKITSTITLMDFPVPPVKMDKVQDKTLKHETWILQLSDGEVKSLIETYDEAKSFNLEDNLIGLDGSTWCLVQYYQSGKSTNCFWTPTANTSERGLESLVSLGQYLWSHTPFRKEYGEIY